MTEPSTDIAEPRPKTPVQAAQYASPIIPQNLDEVYRYSQALALAGDMVPSHFQRRPEAIMAAISSGLEIGLLPNQALRSFAVINGRACLWGDAIPALMQKAGHHVDTKIIGEGDDMVAVATLERGDNGRTIERRFSMTDAKKAGLAGKKGPWQDYPKRMLMMRARGWVCRDGAADAMMGLQIVEEMRDAKMRDVTPKKSGFAALATEARQEAAQADQRENTQQPTEDAEADPGATQEAHDPETGEVLPDPEAEDAIDVDAPEYLAGVEARKSGVIAGDCPHMDDATKALHWLAGWESRVEAGE